MVSSCIESINSTILDDIEIEGEPGATNGEAILFVVFLNFARKILTSNFDDCPLRVLLFLGALKLI